MRGRNWQTRRKTVVNTNFAVFSRHSYIFSHFLQKQQDAREAMRVVFSVLTKRFSMHKKEFLMNIFKFCLKNYIKLHECVNCNSVNYDV